MAWIKDLAQCQLYHCKNPQHDGPALVVQVPGEESPVEILSCLYHQAILTADSGKYSIGRTYLGDIEVRAIAVEFATPPIPPEE